MTTLLIFLFIAGACWGAYIWQAFHRPECELCEHCRAERWLRDE